MAKTNALRLAALVAAAVILAALLVVMTATEPAGAAFPGKNGKIAYHDLNGSIHVANPDGSQARTLTSPVGGVDLAPRWSADGSKIAFQRLKADGCTNTGGPHNREIRVVNADGSGDHMVGWGEDPAWSPDGDKLVVTDWTGQQPLCGEEREPTGLWVVNADGSGATRIISRVEDIEPDLPGERPSTDHHPAWSPDGTKIVFSSDRDAVQIGSTIPAIFTANANGSGITRVATRGGVPDWSPDGRRIAFNRVGKPGDPATLHVINVDGSEEDILGPGSSPAWSPDGTRIAFNGSSLGIAIADPATGTAVTTPLSGLEPDWQPDLIDVDLTEPTWSRQRISGFRDLRFLSTDDHIYYGGFTRVYGAITVRGNAQDALQSLTLEVSRGGVTATARLSNAARAALLQPFGQARQVSFRSTVQNAEPLFVLPAAQAGLFDGPQNGPVSLKVVASTQDGAHPEEAAGEAERLVLYRNANRYPPGAAPADRDGWAGGDGWALPTVRTAAAALDNTIAGTLWGDFSNMNGGHFPPHAGHDEGIDVDGDYGNQNGYDARNAAVARDLIGMLRHPGHGTSVRTILVTYNRRATDPLALCERRGRQPPQRDTDHSAFFKAIQGVRVPAPGGGTRLATAVIRPAPQHCRHFHIRFFPN